MLDVSSLALAIAVQLALALVLAILSWILHRRLSRERYLVYWSLYWAATFILYLGAVAVHRAGVRPDPSPGGRVVLLAVFVPAATMFLAAWSLSGRRVTRGGHAAAVAGVCGTGAAAVLFLRDLFPGVPAEACFLAVRAALEGVAAGAFCLMYATRPGRFQSAAGRVTSLFCGLYAAHLWMFGLSFLRAGYYSAPASLTAAVMGLVLPLGIAAAMTLDSIESGEEVQRKIDLLWEASNDAIRVTDESGIMVQVNRALCRMMEKEEHELLGQPFTCCYRAEAAERMIQRYRQRVAGGTLEARFEREVTLWNGRTLWVELSVSPIPTRKGTLVLNILRDVTARKQAEQALTDTLSRVRDAHQRLRFFVNRMPLAIIAWDASFRVTEWNDAAEQMFGWSCAEALGKNGLDLIVLPRDRERLAVIFATAIRGDDSSYSANENTSKHGGTLFCEWFNTPLRDGSGAVVGVLSVAHDITARIRAEKEREELREQLLQSQKLESAGRLAGGIAHDFNNLLTVINGYARLVLRQLDEHDRLRDPVQQIRIAGDRAAELTQQLLAFGRKQISQPRPLDLNEFVTANSGLFRRLLGEDIEIVTKLDPDLRHLMADPTQIHQVLMNLIANARDAMPGGGRLTIETANALLSKSDCAAHADARPGRFVVLTVGDNGTGIDPKTREHLFEPFYTTKKSGEGTGLGLATVYGIVRQSEGWIQIESEPGQGAAFRLFLPAIDPAPAPADGEHADVSAGRGSETVLIVEDQDALRHFAAMVLESSGYNVLEAAGGEQALRLSETFPAPIHLLLTDVVMPAMTGLHVAERLASARPGLKVLYMSGYAKDVMEQRGISLEGISYLPKPFTPETLAARVRDALDEPAAARA